MASEGNNWSNRIKNIRVRK